MVEVKIKDKVWNLREILAIELDGIDWSNKFEVIKKQVIISTGISEEDYNKLTVRERMVLMHKINELNGFNDFQVPTKE